jgi:cytochrome c553
MGFPSRKNSHMNRFAVLVGTLLVATLAAPALTPQLMLRAAPAPVGNANDGKVFWQAQMCQYCHGVQAEGAWGSDLAGCGISEAGLPRARCAKACQRDKNAV